MTKVFLADNQPEFRSAMKLLLLDLEMDVVGEADSWSTTLQNVSVLKPDMVVISWELIPTHTSLLELRQRCSTAIVIVLVSPLEARQQAALSAGADSFISKGDTPDRVAERLQTAATLYHS